MNQAARDLYQAVILEHNRNPRGYGEVNGATHRAEGFNPICGDKVTVMAQVDGGQISRVGFTTQSCALCRASASVLMASVAHKTTHDVDRLIGAFLSMVTGGTTLVPGDAGAFAAMKDYPARAKCVTLAWRTMSEALNQPVGVNRVVVSTESLSAHGSATVTE